MARKVILAGLEEHWGVLDESRNPDLDDIAGWYEGGVFLVAWEGGEIVGTGAFLPCSNDTVKVVRMSVRRQWRRRGIGSRILDELCRRAYRSGYSRVILETTSAWQYVITFYTKFGFQVSHYDGEDVYFALDLGERFARADE